MIAISALMVAMSMLLRRHPETWADGAQISSVRIRGSVVFTVLLVVSLVLALSIPHLGYWSLLILFAARPVHWLIGRVDRRPESA